MSIYHSGIFFPDFVRVRNLSGASVLFGRVRALAPDEEPIGGSFASVFSGKRFDSEAEIRTLVWWGQGTDCGDSADEEPYFSEIQTF